MNKMNFVNKEIEDYYHVGTVFSLVYNKISLNFCSVVKVSFVFGGDNCNTSFLYVGLMGVTMW